ncbi:ATP-NAD kinase family protein [Parahalioglobus pacificus]|uniref:ATP-NAD kinase n=1 Tax=Parahalioglobus pacificus TaxID=930806 RepID=A0A919CJ02_9GAMM|nr:ATP-NAD kinase family protein [Halioglobus pacificus]GHD29203.1 ATP-NAD kinase [Halioglobus pacificus]
MSAETTNRLILGLLVNPFAGLGGALAMKGSDGDALRERALTLSKEDRARSQGRAQRALSALKPYADLIHIVTCSGAMGAQVAAGMGFSVETVFSPDDVDHTSSDDTRAAVVAFRDYGVDMLLFAGGDGTARDVYDVLGQTLPVLGIPAGVKMHSGVFAVSPEAVGELLVGLVTGGLVSGNLREVRDIDEEAFRADRVKTRYYGDMWVPGEGLYLQQTKVAGRESQALVAADIAAWMADSLSPEVSYLMGPGSTVAAIMEALGLENTLLGVDIVKAGELVAADVDAQSLLDYANSHDHCRIVVTAIGGQGHIFGRGNQQFSPAVIRAVGVENISIVATRTKLAALEGRPLLVDTNDPDLDRSLYSVHTILTGYDDYLLYRVGPVGVLKDVNEAELHERQ